MRHSIFFLFFLFSFGVIQAQKNFTDHLRSEKSGKGKIVIVQSPEIEQIVNGKIIKESSTHNPQDKNKENTPVTPAQPREEHEDLLDKFRTSHEKDHQPEKMQGYRIQVYAGPKSEGQSIARQIEQKCKKALPGISTYVRFIEPRWTCRIGDFQTKADANLFIKKLREADVSPQITIVRCEIFKVY